jgi:hypothetical protein
MKITSYVTAEEIEKERDRNDGEDNRSSGMRGNKEDGNNNVNEGGCTFHHGTPCQEASAIEAQKEVQTKVRTIPNRGRYQTLWSQKRDSCNKRTTTVQHVESV